MLWQARLLFQSERIFGSAKHFLALLDYVSRAHEIKIRPSSVVRRLSSVVRRPSVRPSVASIISEVIAWISFKFLLWLHLGIMRTVFF